MPQETFADRLRQSMAKRGLKQADLLHMAAARDERLGKSQVSQYVSGKVEPRENVARLLAALLDVDVRWLVAGDPARAPERPETAPQPAPSVSGKRSSTMREFKKSSKLDNVLYDVRGPVADEAARMEDEGLRILKLNIGTSSPTARATRTPAASSRRARPSCSTRSSSACPT